MLLTEVSRQREAPIEREYVGIDLHRRRSVDPATVAENVLDTAAPGDRRVHATLEPAVISGDPVLAERLIANLVDNAVRYNVPAGDIWISPSAARTRAVDRRRVVRTRSERLGATAGTYPRPSASNSP
jgi:signal transduction histidine kinase